MARSCEAEHQIRAVVKDVKGQMARPQDTGDSCVKHSHFIIDGFTLLG